jgi:hypothetical protein
MPIPIKTEGTQRFIKMGAAGDTLANTAVDFDMVYDRQSGLVWEIKSKSKTIHWYYGRHKWLKTQTDFIDRLNAGSFGGFSDWRLPTIHELQTLLEGQEKRPVRHERYFPFMAPHGYWSATSCAENGKKVWVVHFGKGAVYPASKTKSSLRVRAVRGPLASAVRLTDAGNGTVVDAEAGLMWQKELSPKTDWAAARAYCSGLSYGGYNDWRLPSVEELRRLVDYRRVFPAALPAGFQWPMAKQKRCVRISANREACRSVPDPIVVWTRTRNDEKEQKFTVDFLYGLIKSRPESEACFVKAVRDIGATGAFSQNGHEQSPTEAPTH